MMYLEIAELEIVGYTRGRKVAVVLRKACSKLGLEGVSHHTYLEHGEVLVEVVAKPMEAHCCCSAAGGAAVVVVGVVDSAVDSAGLAGVVGGVDVVGDQWKELGGFAAVNAHHPTLELGKTEC
jgi:hypothetical protein